ncbi:MAG TPA: hypothetical protein VJB70_01750 [Candidatus Paceibacterota bacterium]
MDFGERHFTILIISVFVLGFVLGFFSYAFFVDKKFHPIFWSLAQEEKGDEKVLGVEQSQIANGERTLRERSLGINLPPPPKASGRNVLVIAPQAAGNTVVISLAALSVDGWIAIHEDAGKGQLGIILGARKFSVGDYFGEPIELLRETDGGRTYFAVLHRDDGDENFNHVTEVPYINVSGDAIKEQFFVTVGTNE